jgi:hypothetical protein
MDRLMYSSWHLQLGISGFAIMPCHRVCDLSIEAEMLDISNREHMGIVRSKIYQNSFDHAVERVNPFVNRIPESFS